MKGLYELKHLMEFASKLPQIQNGVSVFRYKKMGDKLKSNERKFIVDRDGRVNTKLEYHFTRENPIYMNHLANLRVLNKQKDAKIAIENYTYKIRDLAQAAITKKINT